jgi:zinc and cadmium transporter
LAIAGTVVALLVGSFVQRAIVGLLLPVTAGGFVYLAAADLIPELQHDRSPRAAVVQTALIAAGIAVMGMLTWLE